MNQQLRAFAMLAAVLAALSLPAWAKGKQACDDRCQDDEKTCVDICTKKGGTRMHAQCKSMCKDGSKYCLEQCKKKGH